MAATTHPRGVAEMVAIEHETFDRVVRTMVFAVPPAALVVGGWLAWGGALHWQDLLVLAITFSDHDGDPHSPHVDHAPGWRGALHGLGHAHVGWMLHHVTFSINSLCHFVGRRPFAPSDQSRNLAWLAPIAFGEAWHNNHHAFPTSARHGLGRGQLDPSAWLITGLERCHLARDVIRISPERQQAKRCVSAGRDGS